jgi:hypothetical protein
VTPVILSYGEKLHYPPTKSYFWKLYQKGQRPIGTPFETCFKPHPPLLMMLAASLSLSFAVDTVKHSGLAYDKQNT